MTKRHDGKAVDRLRALRNILGNEESLPKADIKSEINVTPLVDVVLVLLIIFMVVTPMIASGVAVDLPTTVHHDRKPDDGRDIIVSVTRDEQIYVASRRVAGASDLTAAVRQERARFPDKTIYLKGDALAPYGTVRRAMDALREAGFEDVTLGTEEPTKKKAEQD